MGRVLEVKLLDRNICPCPGLVGLKGLGVVLQSERLLAPFLVRAHAWVAGSVPSQGCGRGSRLFLSQEAACAGRTTLSSLP